MKILVGSLCGRIRQRGKEYVHDHPAAHPQWMKFSYDPQCLPKAPGATSWQYQIMVWENLIYYLSTLELPDLLELLSHTANHSVSVPNAMEVWDVLELVCGVLFFRPEDRILGHAVIWHLRDGLTIPEIHKRLRQFWRRDVATMPSKSFLETAVHHGVELVNDFMRGARIIPKVERHIARYYQKTMDDQLKDEIREMLVPEEEPPYLRRVYCV